MAKAKKPKHIAVAGNIGAGKTTLTELLSKHYKWIPHFEDVDHNPYLMDFYEDMPRWSFNLQVYFLNSRLKQLVEIQQGTETVIQDRTIYEDANIFAPNLHEMGLMSKRDFDNYFSFFTEKTAKPIIARRLFVAFAGQYHLRNLRRLGFETFDGIINESYDSEPDDILRWQQAWAQVEWLKQQPQAEILAQIQPRAEHNFQVMMSRDWYAEFRDQFEQDFARIVQN